MFFIFKNNIALYCLRWQHDVLIVRLWARSLYPYSTNNCDWISSFNNNNIIITVIG